jgi:hypothetical protein
MFRPLRELVTLLNLKLDVMSHSHDAELTHLDIKIYDTGILKVIYVQLDITGTHLTLVQ